MIDQTSQSTTNLFEEPPSISYERMGRSSCGAAVSPIVNDSSPTRKKLAYTHSVTITLFIRLQCLQKIGRQRKDTKYTRATMQPRWRLDSRTRFLLRFFFFATVLLLLLLFLTFRDCGSSSPSQITSPLSRQSVLHNTQTGSLPRKSNMTAWGSRTGIAEGRCNSAPHTSKRTLLLWYVHLHSRSTLVPCRRTSLHRLCE